MNKDRAFSGSLGTHSNMGILHSYTFEYKLWRDDNTLRASCYIKPPFTSGLDPFGHNEMECELSEENINVVKRWLEEQAEKHPEIIK